MHRNRRAKIVATVGPASSSPEMLKTLFQAGDIWPVLAINAGFLLLSSMFWLGLTMMKFGRRLDD